MIRNLAAKPALLILGAAATLAVFGLATLVVIFVAVQNAHATASTVRPASFQQFDSSPDASASPAEAYPQESADGVSQRRPGGARAVDSLDAEAAGQDAYGEMPQYRDAGQSRQGGQYTQAAYGGNPAGRWTQLVSPDGSATLALPGNWRIAGGSKGMVATEGPSGEQVVLGLQTFVTPNQAPYLGPEQALGWFMRSHGTQLLGIQQHEAQQARSGQSELMVGESELQGRKCKFVARVTTVPIGMGNWMLQVSSMGAPVEEFDGVFPTMQKIWNSWNLDPGYVRSALQQAANMHQQTVSMVANGAMERFNGWKPFNEEMDQNIRGVSTMENSSLGKRLETQIGTERQYLNNCTRNGQDCRQVPTNELIPQQ